MNNNKKMKEIVARIRKRREELNLSYQDLAERTGFGKSTLQRYESGSIRTMPVDRFELLAKGLEIEPYKLMGWDADYLLSCTHEDSTDADIVDLHRNYTNLDENGRKKLIEYSFDLIATGKYSNDDIEEDLDSNESSLNVNTSNETVLDDNTSNETVLNNNTSNDPEEFKSFSLNQMFTTIAAHDDNLTSEQKKECDDIFAKELSKILNKK